VESRREIRPRIQLKYDVRIDDNAPGRLKGPGDETAIWKQLLANGETRWRTPVTIQLRMHAFYIQSPRLHNVPILAIPESPDAA